MVSPRLNDDIKQELVHLESRLEELIRTCRLLKEENRLLRKQQEDYTVERANLIEKNQEARMRVEAMINRLKSLEQGG